MSWVRFNSLQASAAAVIFTSTLPLGDAALPIGRALSGGFTSAIGEVAPHAAEDDFPPYDEDMSSFEIRTECNGYESDGFEDTPVDPVVACIYGSGEYTEDLPNLKISAGEGGDMQTRSITCPKSDEQEAFGIKFHWWTPRLHSYFMIEERHDWSFLDSHRSPGLPPDGTGLDPLKGLRNSAVSRALSRLDEFTWSFGKLDFGIRALKSAAAISEEVCMAVKEAVKGKFGTFKDMCREYLRVYEEARDMLKKSANTRTIRTSSRHQCHLETVAIV
ncbi:hypothetical protein FOZ62_028892 [Perkinsus olseni]|uniref:Uncharacterized protein n=1 Tax=Perkinsus olseni TaxID=32597 RepID=A0A7J6S6G6_PEROL|nr:hypothetical protein FOZ62_028892 [Perkinsus olseni]